MEIVVPLNEKPVVHHREECNDCLTITTRPLPGNPTHKLLSATNHAYDTASKIVYAFDSVVPIQALGSTVTSTRTDAATNRLLNVFTAVVNPMQKVELLSGPFAEHASRSISASAADAAFFVARATHAESAVDAGIAHVRGAVRQAQQQLLQQQEAARPGSGGGTALPPLSSEAVAQICSRASISFVDLAFAPKTPTALLRDCDTGPLGSGNNPIVFLRPDEALRGTAKLRATVPTPSLFYATQEGGSAGGGGRNHIRPDNVCQGTLGDCYFCCTLSSMAAHPRLVCDAFSSVQEPYRGIFRVLMCKHGWWQCVVVDDYLPTQSGRLCFTRNKQHPTQLWVPIMEKAYAKAHGSYAAIRAGDAPLAMMDLTGCPYIHFNKLPEFDDKDRLFELLLRGIANAECMATVGTPSKATMDPTTFATKAKAYDAIGLTMDHAYSVLDAVVLQGAGGATVRLLRLRDPWGGGTGAKSKPKVFSGAYAAGDAAWTPTLRAQLAACRTARAQMHGEVASPAPHAAEAAEQDDNGSSFWMLWEDCVKYFDNGALCRIDVRAHKQLRIQGLMAPSGWCSIALSFRVVTPRHGGDSGESVSLSCSFGAHQKDRRSIPPTVTINATGAKVVKPPPPYLGLLLTVLVVDVKTMKTLRVVANSSAQGSFGNYRDVFTPQMQLPPNGSEDECYVVVVQSLVAADAAAAADRPLVLSAIWDAPEALCADVRILALRPPSERIKGTSTTAPFVPPITFQPANYITLADRACWQARMTYPGRDGVLVVTRSGGNVDAAIFCTEPKQATPPPAPARTTNDSVAEQVGHQDRVERPGLSDGSEALRRDAVETATSVATCVAPACGPSKTVEDAPRSHLHLLLLDAVLDAQPLPRIAESAAQATVAAHLCEAQHVAVNIQLVARWPTTSGAGRDDAQVPINGRVQGFESRSVLMEPVPEASAEHPAVDGVVKDVLRSTDGSAADACHGSMQTWRAVWCEGTRLAIQENVPTLQDFRLEAQLVDVTPPALSKGGEERASLRILATGSMSLQPRDLRRGGSGQMVTIVLHAVEKQQTAQSSTEEASDEVGEVHLGLSWV